MGTSITLHDQTRRLLRLKTALGEDALIPTAMDGWEAMSQGFSYKIDVFSESLHEIPAEKIIGTAASFQLVQEDGTPRNFHGYVSHISTLGRHYGGQRSNYQINIVPWTWFLGARSACRIFQDVTVQDVLEKLFSSLGEIARFEFLLQRTHARHRFLVQYNETDLNFFNRLIRREGIAFYIRHDNDGHTLCLVDDPDELPTLEPQQLELQAGGLSERLSSWIRTNSFVTGRYASRSYNYKESTKLLASESKLSGLPASISKAMEMEHYHYSEAYTNEQSATAYGRRWVEQSVERQAVVIGHGTYRNLQAGHHFTVAQVPEGEWPDQGQDFTLASVQYKVDNIGEQPYSASFEAIPKGRLAHAREGQPVVISSLQTATVTGPQGEEVHTDQLGRIKVQFHWDRDGKHDENTTCWLRVMQSFAGPGFGEHFTPRIGQEVVVAFENGNPDRPFVLGSLYHKEHAPPYSGKPTQSGIKTRTIHGGASNFNELRFDDDKGNEEVYLQAEKDLTLLVKNNLAARIEESALYKVGKKYRLQAGEEIELVVGGSSIKITDGKIEIQSGTVDVDGKNVKIN